ncbi:Protein kinase domain, partial [Trinorchestia longiramus]
MLHQKLPLNRKTKHSLLRSLRHEAHVLAALSHPCVVSLVEVCVGRGGELALALEDLGGTSLSNLVETSLSGRLCESLVGCVALHMGRALEYLHSRNFLHRDVKPENIMVENSTHCYPHAKLIDLGLSIKYCKENPPNSSQSRAGTLAYMAPELMSANVFYGEKIDVFSLGASLYFSITGEEPFSAYTTSSGRRSSTSVFGLQFHHEDSLDQMSPEMSEVVKGMLQLGPDERWSIDKLLKSRWLRQTTVSRAYAQHLHTCLAPLSDRLLLLHSPLAPGASVCHTTACHVPAPSKSSTLSKESFSTLYLSDSSSLLSESRISSRQLKEPRKSSSHSDLSFRAETPEVFSPVGPLSHSGTLNPCSKIRILRDPADVLDDEESGCRVVGQKDQVCRSLSSSECACYDMDMHFEETTLFELARLTGEDVSVVKNKIKERPWGEIAGMYNLLRLKKASIFCG